MSIVLLTFLGRVPKQESGYRTIRYVFNSQPDEPTAFFGYNLLRRVTPGRMVVLGTAGSMWDHLFEKDLDFGNLAEEERLDLVEAVEKQQVTPSLLTRLQPLLSKQLGCDVVLELIPYGRTIEEQVQLVELMARHVQPSDIVHLDITHGFRSLPMIAFLAALYLREVRKAHIDGIWYGAYDPDTGEAPVQNLGGLLRIAEWLSALTCYSKDGDFGVFAPLLGDHGELLAQAAFFERTSNPIKAKEKLISWSKEDCYPHDDPAAVLFYEELQRRIAWHRAGIRPAYESRLAQEYLERRDFVRASIFGLESLISAEIFQKKIADDIAARKEVGEQLRKNNEDYCTLNSLRNALAHGLRAQNRAVERALIDEQTLYSTIKSLFKQLRVN